VSAIVPSVQVTAFTHPGLVRPHNEDCIAVGDWLWQGVMEQPAVFVHRLDRPLLCLVADGLGGHAAGEFASQYAARRLGEETPGLDGDGTALARCLQIINAELYEAMRGDRRREGMATTVAGLLATSSNIIVFNVGDSRVYRHDHGALTQLSSDDTPEALYGGGYLGLRRSSAITQCLGGVTPDSEIYPHLVTQSLTPGCDYLLCSDGLTDMVDHRGLQAGFSDDPAQTASVLFEQAMAAGGEDNISIVIMRINETP